MEGRLMVSDYMLSDKDLKKQEKELARLKKIQETKSTDKKPLTIYQVEYNEMIQKMEEKLKKKGSSNNAPVIVEAKNKIPEKNLLGGLYVNPLVSKAEKRKKIGENINGNHIYMKERYLQRIQESENPHQATTEVEDEVEDQNEMNSKSYSKDFNHWNSYSQFPKPILNQQPKPKKPILSLKPKPSGLTSSQYKLSLKIFNK